MIQFPLLRPRSGWERRLSHFLGPLTSFSHFPDTLSLARQFRHLIMSVTATLAANDRDVRRRVDPATRLGRSPSREPFSRYIAVSEGHEIG